MKPGVCIATEDNGVCTVDAQGKSLYIYKPASGPPTKRFTINIPLLNFYLRKTESNMKSCEFILSIQQTRFSVPFGHGGDEHAI